MLLGDAQFAQAADWEDAGLLALVGMGVEPGLSDVFARYAADHLFSEIDEVAVRDGANLTVDGYAFAPTFSIWTTIEECLNPPLIWERDRGHFVTAPFSEPETFDFPEGIGPVECVNVEHEEVVLIPQVGRLPPRDVQVRPRRGVHRRAADAAPARARLDGADRRARRLGGAPRRRGRGAARTRPSWATACTGCTCAGTYVTGTGKDGAPARDLPLPRGRQRGDDAPRRLPGGRVADGDQRRRRDGAAGRRASGRAPACSGRRPSTRRRSSSCSPTTAAPTACRSASSRSACGSRCPSSRRRTGSRSSRSCARSRAGRARGPGCRRAGPSRCRSRARSPRPRRRCARR